MGDQKRMSASLKTPYQNSVSVYIIIWILEKGWGFEYEGHKKIIYERIELLHETRRDEIIGDLILRSELIIYNLETDSTDYLKDTAEITIYYPIKKKVNRID